MSEGREAAWCPYEEAQRAGGNKAEVELRKAFKLKPLECSKASVYNVGDPGSISGSGRSPEEGNGNPLQYSCLENPMDGGAWWAAVHGVGKSQTRLSDFTFTFFVCKCVA